MSKKKYRVQNPRNFPKDVQLVYIGERGYMLGETVTVEPESVKALIEQGFLKEVKRGKE